MSNGIEKTRELAYVDGSGSDMYGYYLAGANKIFIVHNQVKTNNEAEWLALYTLIMDVPKDWCGLVCSDSQLVVNQFLGTFQVKNEELRKIYTMCKNLCYQKNLDLRVVWIPREQNVIGKKLDIELAKKRAQRWARAGKENK